MDLHSSVFKVVECVLCTVTWGAILNKDWFNSVFRASARVYPSVMLSNGSNDVCIKDFLIVHGLPRRHFAARAFSSGPPISPFSFLRGALPH